LHLYETSVLRLRLAVTRLTNGSDMS
jgi:hypothetical protein